MPSQPKPPRDKWSGGNLGGNRCPCPAAASAADGSFRFSSRAAHAAYRQHQTEREIPTTCPDQRLHVELRSIGALSARLFMRRVGSPIGAPGADAPSRIVRLANRLDSHKNRMGTWRHGSQAGELSNWNLELFVLPSSGAV
jgi:hypothetical protein